MKPYHRLRQGLLSLTVALILLLTHARVPNAQAAQPAHTFQATALYLPLVNAIGAPPDTPTTVHIIAIDHAAMNFYPVEGDSADAIRAGLNQARPGGYDAYTEWNFSWFAPDDGNGSCDLDAVIVKYTITVTFPQWTPPQDATPQLIEHWNNYIDALAIHESGHVERVYPNIPDLYQQIKASTCDTYGAVAQAWLENVNQANADYDTETNHGATQGAIFP